MSMEAHAVNLPFLRRIERGVRRLLFGPRIVVYPGPPLLRLGSPYGGWVLEDLPELHKSTILSCGLGEDASFDVEFARHFNATVVVVDPTPRAIEHFRTMQEHMGRDSTLSYPAGGRMPPDAYDLSDVRADQLVLVPSAVADRGGTAEFFAPPDPEHVSYSLVNFQNSYSRDTPSITVPTISVQELQTRWATPFALVKMDIEGAEIAAILAMLDADIIPTQLLIEFDELNRPSMESRRRFEIVKSRLVVAGYRVRFFDGRSNFLFSRATSPNETTP